MRLAIAGARVVDWRGDRAGMSLVVDGARLADPGPDDPTVDASELTVLPGFIDVHTHGGGGFGLHTLDPDEIRCYAAWAPSTGCTAFLAGVVGIPAGLPLDELSAAAGAAGEPGPGAEILGIHLEGPFLNPSRRGAHDPSWLRMPSREAALRMIDAARGWLRIVTLAPELPNADAAMAAFVAAGVVVSIGHTDATYDETNAAIGRGARHATHCFNAMPPLLHRAPGPLGAVADASDVLGELIADGVHVQPPAMRALLRLLGVNRTVIVTDAQSGAGLDDPVMMFAGMPARVSGGVARLADGTIAGSVLTMDRALRNAVAMLGATLPEASAMLTANPARAAGAAGRKGLLAPGYDADLVVLDADLAPVATYCRGQLAFAATRWLDRLRAAGVEP